MIDERVTIEEHPAWAADLAAKGLKFERAVMAVYNGEMFATVVSRAAMADDEDDVRWRVSVSGRDGRPSLDAIVAIAHKLRPGIMFAIAVPTSALWAKYHPKAVLLHEVKDETMLAQMRMDAEAGRS